MANTRKLDREIAAMKNKLEQVRSQKSIALSAGDQAKLAALTGYAFAKATRLKSAPGAERAADRIWKRAEESAAADLRVLEGERQQLVDAEAAARREKKTSGWW
ncbi:MULTISPECIES: hypothetical protein [unclassified Streptomyces]|uniref:hypothetical protein n=1 Tax=unclassified Streptomyces TaxID=2593676 RepID=UPI002257C840|nr:MULTISPECIES: hypothetical protein [unclassified Streptomyces]MCX4871101.1 hypothetical protein [Streptomyces sp. NBC_00906]MCX4902723.1 hypothetical protein [Streptomyces sp. NBC_00892]